TLASGGRGIDRGQGDAVFCRYGPGSFLSNLDWPRTAMASWMSPAVRRVQGMLHGSRESGPNWTDWREIRSDERHERTSPRNGERAILRGSGSGPTCGRGM